MKSQKIIFHRTLHAPVVGLLGKFKTIVFVRGLKGYYVIKYCKVVDFKRLSLVYGAGFVSSMVVTVLDIHGHSISKLRGLLLLVLGIGFCSSNSSSGCTEN